MAKRKKSVGHNLAGQIIQFIEGKSFRPMKEPELLAALAVAEQHQPLVRELLQGLVRDGELQIQNDRYSLPEGSDVIQGTLSMHPRGFGFLKGPDGTEIFIAKHLAHHAVDGDLVEVEVISESAKGPEGRVLAILKRGRTHLAGTIFKVSKKGLAEVHVPVLGTGMPVVAKAQKGEKLKVGDRVVLHVTQWGSRQTPTKTEISHHLGHIDDPSVDTAAGCEEFELRLDFPTKVRNAAKRFGTRVSPKDIKEREDFRDIETITIDPKTAKDFDDALSISVDEKGCYHLAVHIADVSHYVAPGSPLDREASTRCNSTYLPGYCVPMLPKELSDNLCSLKPKVNRLAVTVLMRFDPNGELEEYDIVRSVIKSDKRFTYEEAMQVLDGKRKSRHAEALENMVKLCNKLKLLRKDRGGVEFAIPEAVLEMDDEGMPTGIRWVEYDITHQLVEEFMIKANEVVARHIDDEGGELPYRVHDEPDKEKLLEFALLARQFGYKMSDEPTQKELIALFDKSHGKPEAKQIAIAYIRSMQMAIYSPTNVGHFGLKLEHYCHFTSPIRRYIDLVIHRTLFGHQPSDEELIAISERCSEQERKSARAEQQVKTLKKLRLLQAIDEREPHKQFDAVIASCKPFGVVFEVADLVLEGFIHISQLGHDYFIYDERRQQLVGDVSRRTFRVGDAISVVVKEVNLITLETEWAIVGGDQPQQRGKRGKRRRR